MIKRLLLALTLAAMPASAIAANGKPPVVDAAAEGRAARVLALGDGDPAARMNQLLAARDLDDAALFVVAGTYPGVVEQIIDEEYSLAVDFINVLPAPELHRIRRGETVIRGARVLRGSEFDAAVAMAEHFNWKGFKEKKLESVRVGPQEGRSYRVEVTFRKNKNKVFRDAIELAWPSTPERDEQSRDKLSKYFGARPSKSSRATLDLKDGSFEDPTSLGAAWQLVDAVMFGTRTPDQTVTIDNSSALDGLTSLRFYADERTRLFHEAVQRVPVAPGTRLRVRTQCMAENLRVEFQQREDHVSLNVVFLDANGYPLGEPHRALARLSTHTWELIEIETTAPPGAAFVQVGMMSAVSGTARFDGVKIDVIQ